MTREKRTPVLITGPSLTARRGVATYYRTLLPFLQADQSLDTEYTPIGSEGSQKVPFHKIVDQARVYRALRKHQPMLLHMNPSLTLNCIFREGLIIHLCKNMQVPVLVFFRGWNQHLEEQISGYLKGLFRFMFSHADAFIVLARSFEHSLRSWGFRQPIYLQNTVLSKALIQNTKQENRFEQMEKPDSLRILFMSSIERNKGIFELLKSVSSLLEEGHDLSLTIAGEGRHTKQLTRYLSHHSLLQSHVDVVGFVEGERKLELYKTHHVFCLPTHYEGMPNAVLEAMVFGLPVITCPVGGLVDFFREKEMGWLVPPGKVDALSNALKNALDDRPCLAGIAHTNHTFACEQFSASTAADEIKEIYREVIERYNTKQ